MFDALVRWIDNDIDHHMTNQTIALVMAAGVVPGVVAGWNWFTIATGVVWGAAWVGLWLWRMFVWLEKETVKKRRRVRRQALRDRKAALAKLQEKD